MSGRRLAWSLAPRTTPAAPSDTRRARVATFRRADGSIAEYRIEPSRDTYCIHWIVSLDGTPVATARALAVAMRTVERGAHEAGRTAA